MIRPRSTRMLLAGALIAAIAMAGPAVAVATTGWITKTLTSDSADHGNVSVSGNRVVWQANDGEYDQIYTWKFGVDAAPRPVTTSETQHGQPVVSGDRVVWAELVDIGAPFGSRYQVFTIRVGVETTPTRVSTEPYDCDQISVSGDRIVWRQSSGTSNQVYTRKMGTDATPVSLHGGLPDHSEPRVSGDRVVWLEGDYHEVFTWKSGDLVVTQVTNDPNQHYVPQVSGDRIVWEGQVAADNQIFTRKMGTDPTAIQLTNDAHAKDDPAVSGDRVLWDEFPGGLGQVFTRKMGTDSSPKTVSPLVFNLYVPQLSSDRVVWSNYESGAPRILTRKLGADATSTLLATGNNVQGAMVSGDRVVWLQYGAGTTIHQVIFAKLITTPKITRSPGSSTITVKRKSGIAKYTLSATIKDADGAILAGRRVYLQTSANGSTHWKNTYALTANAAGKVSKGLSWRTKGTRYYRWYVPAVSGYKAVSAGRQKVVVR